jgi:hypothetical protein
MQISYVGPFDEVEVPGVGVVKRGESVSVASELAGRVPSDEDLGAGLLAQPSNWAPAKAAPAKKNDEVSS